METTKYTPKEFTKMNKEWNRKTWILRQSIKDIFKEDNGDKMVFWEIKRRIEEILKEETTLKLRVMSGFEIKEEEQDNGTK